MDTRLRARIEIETLHELLPQLDHYRLLGLKPGCPQADVDAAFRAESRRLHPDRHTAGAPPELKSKVNEVFKAVNDAYRVLRDPESRTRYDNDRREGDFKVAMEAKKEVDHAAAARLDPAKAPRTPNGEKYWKMALQCVENKDFNGGVMQARFALQFEADNEVMREWMGKWQAEADARKKTGGNAYRIRLG